MTYTLQIRPKRQATFPSSLLEALGVGVGDSLNITLEGKRAIIKPSKQATLDALKEIQKIFKESGVTEKEMLEDLDRQRGVEAKKYASKSS